MGARWRAYFELTRLPAVFTAVADVMMGYLVTQGTLGPIAHSALLIAASGLLYLAGMVLNDVFDAAVDARERPERPIPSGRVSRTNAAGLGWALLVAGVMAGWLVAFLCSDWRPGCLATLLALAVVCYDAVLKRTLLGPLAMAVCRLLNVLLGMSLAVDALTRQPRSWSEAEWSVAIGVGVYVLGLTLFARTEARVSSRRRLAAGMVILLGGMALLASLPTWTNEAQPLQFAARGWYVLWILLALIIARRCMLAILQPVAHRVQAAVRNCLMSIIVLDAVVSAGFVGIWWSCTVVLLLVPMLLFAWLFDVT